MLDNLKYYIIYLFSIITRFFPLATTTGIIKIGEPNGNSPVLITGNYKLTVEILKKTLKDENLYLLVANSKGINVWCAATGGHFTNHDVISILKTSGISKMVDHRKYILPQLAGTGIEPYTIKQKTGWNGVWGPTYAQDIPDFLNQNYKLKVHQRQVKFPILNRLELAVAWAFFMSIVFYLILIWFSSEIAIYSLGLGWIITLSIFLSFPLFESYLRSKKKIGGLTVGKLLVK